ncbi:molybdopterin-dependent oxidoreductase [Streptomyces avermitilis]
MAHPGTAEAAWHKTPCIPCENSENNCGIQIQLDGRRFAKIRGDKEHVATRGCTCNKALRLGHHQNGGTRLTTPQRREADGSFTPIGWDTAIRGIAARLKAVRDAHGGESLFYYAGAGQGDHLGGVYSGALLRAPGRPLPLQRPGPALPTQDGTTQRVGVAVNTLTDLHRRDPSSGTPWHKHVPARI